MFFKTQPNLDFLIVFDSDNLSSISFSRSNLVSTNVSKIFLSIDAADKILPINKHWQTDKISLATFE